MWTLLLILEHASSPIDHCLQLIRDVTNIINYKCLSKRKIAEFRKFFIFGMYSIISFRTLSENMPSLIFLNCGKMVIIVNLEEMRMCLIICNLGPFFIISRPMKENCWTRTSSFNCTTRTSLFKFRNQRTECIEGRWTKVLAVSFILYNLHWYQTYFKSGYSFYGDI